MKSFSIRSISFSGSHLTSMMMIMMMLGSVVTVHGFQASSKGLATNVLHPQPTASMFQTKTTMTTSTKTTLWSSPFDDIERPDPSVLLSSQDDNFQKLGVGAIGIGILGGTFVLVDVLHFFESLLPIGFFDIFRDFLLPLPIGLLYLLLGVSHFFYTDDYAETVPPKGTWGGLWDVPAPSFVSENLGWSTEKFHVLWTGIAEVGGGALLLLGLGGVVPIAIPAALLFLLTLAVTPSNVYMFTHDAQMKFAPPVPYPWGHFGRAVLQCVFLSCLWILAFH